jgi:hypothetical protein
LVSARDLLAKLSACGDSMESGLSQSYAWRSLEWLFVLFE